MVVLAAAVTTKGGRALLSRQFVQMNRIRIEGLLAAFPKLVGSGSKQHTFIETESVRYVYQPMENLFLLIITTKASNIVQDLETLRLLSKVVPDVIGTLSEENVKENCFNLIFAFDEVINSGGYKENITLQQIRTNMEMESHEEKLHMMIKKSKIDSAKEQMKQKALAIKKAQNSGGGGGFGGGGLGGGDTSSADVMGGDGPEVINSDSSFTPDVKSEPEPVHKPRIQAKGMSLGKKPKGMNLMGALAAEEGMSLDAIAPPTTTTPGGSVQQAAPAPAAPESNDPVNISIEEKMSVVMNREGALESMEIKGTLGVTVNDETVGKCEVPLKIGKNPDFKFQTHPKVGKPRYAKENVIALKDASKPFPTGTKVGVLRWNSKPSDGVPITINCWPEEEGGGVINVNIEYTLENEDMELRDVNIQIPLGTTEAPSIISVDGDYKHNSRDGVMLWHLDLIDSSNSTGTLEFTISGNDTEAFFPVEVAFYSAKLFCDVEVEGVRSVDGQEPIRYGSTRSLVTDSFVVE